MALILPPGPQSGGQQQSLYPQGAGQFSQWQSDLLQETTGQWQRRKEEREGRRGRPPEQDEQGPPPPGLAAERSEAEYQQRPQTQQPPAPQQGGQAYKDPSKSTLDSGATKRPGTTTASGAVNQGLRDKSTANKSGRYRAVTNNYIRVFQNELEKLGPGGEVEARAKAAKQVAKMLGDDADLFEEILASDPQSLESRPFANPNTSLQGAQNQQNRLTPDVERKIQNMVHAQQMGEKFKRFMGGPGVLGDRMRGMVTSGVPLGQGDQGFDAAAMDMIREQAGGPKYGGGYPPRPQAPQRTSVQGGVVGPGPTAPMPTSTQGAPGAPMPTSPQGAPGIPMPTPPAPAPAQPLPPQVSPQAPVQAQVPGGAPPRPPAPPQFGGGVAPGQTRPGFGKGVTQNITKPLLRWLKGWQGTDMFSEEGLGDEDPGSMDEILRALELLQVQNEGVGPP